MTRSHCSQLGCLLGVEGIGEALQLDVTGRYLNQALLLRDDWDVQLGLGLGLDRGGAGFELGDFIQVCAAQILGIFPPG